ncbi:hypothetical protein NIES4071_29300 [Calothrix sp. NIES-4071]|nr:hypothetical protein NIES4071_29300 [Calothrix sp. NIES-4071]BAZ57250.1 hypothetical protein NIES4105_29240 [Calothrix sp. NIES-4105]
MKKIIPVLLSLATASVFLLGNEPAQAHRYRKPYHGGYYGGYYGNFYGRPYPTRYCYPLTRWFVNQDPAYHPRAYSDGYRQGRESAKKGNSYKERTAGGEFARGFDDGFYGREFKGQKHIVANVYQPFTTSECDWY